MRAGGDPYPTGNAYFTFSRIHCLNTSNTALSYAHFIIHFFVRTLFYKTNYVGRCHGDERSKQLYFHEANGYISKMKMRECLNLHLNCSYT